MKRVDVSFSGIMLVLKWKGRPYSSNLRRRVSVKRPAVTWHPPWMTFYYNTLKSDNPLRRKEPSSFKLRQCFVEIRVVLHLFVQLVNRLVTLQREPGLKLASGNVAAVSHKLGRVLWGTREKTL